MLLIKMEQLPSICEAHCYIFKYDSLILVLNSTNPSIVVFEGLEIRFLKRLGFVMKHLEWIGNGI